VSVCHATGVVKANNYAGGLVGENSGAVDRSYAAGAVMGGARSGGLVGSNDGLVSACYATGAVKGFDTMGGLVGNNYGILSDCYAAGPVTATWYPRGLVGSGGGTVDRSYWDTNTTGQALSAGGVGKGTAEMKQRATFAGWDFTNVWRITEGVTYPLFAEAARVIGVSGSLAFGNVTVGQTAMRDLTITNSGNMALTVTGITCPAGFSGAWNGTIAAGGSHAVPVTFSPVALQAYGGTVTVRSDKTAGGNTIVASGTGVQAPQPGQICLNASAYTAQEGVKRKVLVRRINGSNGTVSVTYVLKPKTALAGQDYVVASGTLTWTNGQTAAKVLKLVIPADRKTEGNETFQILLRNPVNATLAVPNKATITILANSKGVRPAAETMSIRIAGLAEALEAEGLPWSTSTRLPWARQAFVTVDGLDAAVSGQGDPERASWLQTEVEGPGMLEFDWLVRGAGLDACLFVVDGRVLRTRGPGFAWTHESVALGDGAHTVRWILTGESRLIPGTAYVDQVKWMPGRNDSPPVDEGSAAVKTDGR
jgi:hypothetical protein